MIPEYNDDGYLPPGIHRATLDEIAARFGQESELRQAQMDSLRWLVDAAWKAGAQRIVVNGSFVTEKLEPNNVDCVPLIGPDFPHDAVAEAVLLAGLIQTRKLATIAGHISISRFRSARIHRGRF